MSQRSFASPHPRRIQGLVFAAAVVVFAAVGLVTASAPAQACCTNTTCAWCDNSRSDCCGPQWPTCNAFGCNCNPPCGTYSGSFECVWNPGCGDAASAKAAAQKRFDEIDANHDGKISLDEMGAWLKKQKIPFLKHLDKKNLPPGLEATEANEKALLKRAFDQMDKDHDGFIEPAEFDNSLGPGR